ncbi:MAG: Hpt domain-containing protein [Desulfobacterales bacterium]|nr:Hpt domain-containing protein [Desulfobacterales bacterium]
MKAKKLAENLGLEEEKFAELFGLYKETASSDLKELKFAISAGDAEKAHEKAHSIKGASGNLGLDELYETAKAIDDRARVNSLDGLEKMFQEFWESYDKLVKELEKSS